MEDNNIITGEREKQRMKVVFIRTNVLFPHQILNFELGKDNEILRVIEDARAKNEDVLVITEKNGNVNKSLPNDAYKVGTTAKVTQILRLPNDTARAIVRGERRMMVEEYISVAPFVATVTSYGEDVAADDAET